MYKYILFDLDDTILDFKLSEYHSISMILKRYNLDSPFLINKFQEINEEEFQSFQNGLYKTRLDFQIGRFKKFFGLFNIEEDFLKINEEFLNNLKRIVFLKDNAIKVLEYLSKKYDLYVASNGMYEVQMERLENAGIKCFFKDFFISSKIGYNKPKKEFFDYVYNSIKGNLNDYLIIGDRMESDILGGKNYGIDQVLIGSGEATYVIKNLKELFDIL